jgi:hypothetical protein
MSACLLWNFDLTSTCPRLKRPLKGRQTRLVVPAHHPSWDLRSEGRQGRVAIVIGRGEDACDECSLAGGGMKLRWWRADSHGGPSWKRGAGGLAEFLYCKREDRDLKRVTGRHTR